MLAIGGTFSNGAWGIGRAVFGSELKYNISTYKQNYTQWLRVLDMTNDNRTQLMNLLNTALELKYDSILMKEIKRVSPMLNKSVDVCVQCAQEMIDHPETPDENVVPTINSMNSLIHSLNTIRDGIKELYPSQNVVTVPNWNAFLVNPVMVH